MNHQPRLRTTAFEELMLAQDSATYPCNIYVRMGLSGSLDRDHFTSAVRAMIEHHPLLRATLQSRSRRSAWMIQESVQESIQWRTYRAGELESPECLNLPIESQFDLQREPGISIVVLEPARFDQMNDDVSQTLVAIKIHHAVADGLGINAAIHDLWLAYDAFVHNRPLTLSNVDAKRLDSRNRFVPNLATLLRLIPKQLVGLLGVKQYLMRRPMPLVSRNVDGNADDQPLSFAAVSRTFDEQVVESLRQESKQRKISLNDLLAAYVFRACHSYRTLRESVTDSQWLRMMVPVSLRNSEAFQTLPACNVVSSVFLDRTPSQIRDFDSLAQSVHDEMELIKSHRLALMFIFSLWVRKHLTFTSKKQTIKSCQTSVVFSNLGKLFFKSPIRDKNQCIAPGNLTLESFEIYAPLTPFMDAAFTTLIYRSRLTLSLRYDPRRMNSEDAAKLLDQVATEFPQPKFAEVAAT